MANLIRCDNCKKLSDEPGISFIGKEWRINHYKDYLGTIKVFKDLCRECVIKLVNENALAENKDDY